MKNIVIDEFIERIKLDKEHGASQLGRKALKALKLLIKRSEDEDLSKFLINIKHAGFKLANTRSSMASLINLVGKAVYLIEENSRSFSLKELKEFAILKIDELIFESENAVNKIADLTSKIIKDKIVITHSFSSTVIEAIKKSNVKKVIVSESRPLFEGRNTAIQLSKFNVPTVLITDAALGFFSSKAEAALVGCDSILADGSIVNKVGTYLLALAAKDSNIPFYVASETIKIDPKSVYEEVKLEEGCKKEVAEKIPKKIKIENLYFDVTKSSLINALITEEGIIKPEEIKNKVKEFKKYLNALKLKGI
jgi:eIF-2B alpha/beta/delta-like uncharacterized protein